MKKIGCILAVFCLLISLCSCGAGNGGPQETLSTESSEAESIPETTEHQPETTEPETEATTQATEPPVTEQARERIREGEYQQALELLEGETGDEAELLRLRAGLGDVQVGDQVILGSYEQDGNGENGTEEISWMVLARENDRVFLLSTVCLDSQPFHDVIDGYVTWEECALRTWLNEDFCNAAFSETEQKLLARTELVNADNDYYGTVGGENTVDRVFLLSVDEVNEYLTQEQRLASVTEYAKDLECFSNGLGRGWWWLRSPGKYSRDACYVGADGKVSVYGYVVHRPGWAIRPAVWIDLSVY